MIYDSKKQIDVQNAIERFKSLVKKGALIELKEKRKRRSVSQNAYMHLLFDWFANQTGYTSEEVKQDIFKKHVNSNLFYNGDFDGIVRIDRWRSTSDLNTKEMTLAIERFRNFSSKEAGIYLPEPNDLAHIQEIEIELSKHENQKYL